MILLILRTNHSTKHAVRLAHSFDYEILHCLAKLFIPFDAEQTPINNFAIVLSPVATLLELLPVPARDSLASETFKNEQLPRFLVFDKHTHVVVA